MFSSQTKMNSLSSWNPKFRPIPSWHHHLARFHLSCSLLSLSFLHSSSRFPLLSHQHFKFSCFHSEFPFSTAVLAVTPDICAVLRDDLLCSFCVTLFPVKNTFPITVSVLWCFSVGASHPFSVSLCYFLIFLSLFFTLLSPPSLLCPNCPPNQ